MSVYTKTCRGKPVLPLFFETEGIGTREKPGADLGSGQRGAGFVLGRTGLQQELFAVEYRSVRPVSSGAVSSGLRIDLHRENEGRVGGMQKTGVHEQAADMVTASFQDKIGGFHGLPVTLREL